MNDVERRTTGDWRLFHRNRNELPKPHGHAVEHRRAVALAPRGVDREPVVRRTDGFAVLGRASVRAASDSAERFYSGGAAMQVEESGTMVPRRWINNVLDETAIQAVRYGD